MDTLQDVLSGLALMSVMIAGAMWLMVFA